MLRLGAALLFLHGVICCILISLSFIFLVPLIGGITQHNWGLVIWCVFMVMTGIIFWNMAYFFRRLKSYDAYTYMVETRGRGFIGHVGWCSGFVLQDLHASVSRVATDNSGRFSRGLLLYARITRYLNIVALICLLAGVLAFGLSILYAKLLA